MTDNKTRAVTAVSHDHYVFLRDGDLNGICIELWKRVARDLNIEYSLVSVTLDHLIKDETADVLIQRMDARLLETYFASE